MTTAATTTPRRVALYSHDTQGLGHVRRNIELASALVADDPNTDVLVLTGNPEAAVLPLPPATDLCTLPTVRKGADGSYHSRAMGGGLEPVLRIRSGVLEAALDRFDPHLLIVDKVALGLCDELEPALRTLRERGTARTVLGLREVLDAPRVAIREWDATRTSQAVGDYYDAVWVYGDPAVYDPVTEYQLPHAVATKTVYTGYLGHRRGAGAVPRPWAQSAVSPPGRPYSLCLVGGGQDGLALAETFVRARLPEGQAGVVLTGPFMGDSTRRRLQELASDRPEMSLLGFAANPANLVDGATSVVSMAGYNSVCELLSAGAPTLLVPRATPRAEQLVRSQRLAELGLVDMLTPDALDPQAIGSWLASPPERPTAGRLTHGIDLDGLRRVPHLAADLLAGTRTEGVSRAA